MNKPKSVGASLVVEAAPGNPSGLSSEVQSWHRYLVQYITRYGTAVPG
jgi:hypothetical protein